MKDMLLIMPKYFGYEDYLTDELIRRGYNVHRIYENVGDVSFFYRWVIVFMKRRSEKLLSRYYLNRINRIGSRIDTVLVIKGGTLTIKACKAIVNRWPDARRIMYQWDSIDNNSNAIAIAPFFNKILTFDRKDADKMGWLYRPLFYIPELCTNRTKDIDICFIGLLHSQRLEIYQAIKALAYENGYKLFLHVFTFLSVYLRHRFLMRDPCYGGVKISEICFRPLSVRRANEAYSRSKVIVDYTHPDQAGLTMRTIECIGHGSRLLTNNKNITEADFYDERYIQVYHGRDISVPDAFLTDRDIVYPENVLQEYSLSGFIDDIIED